VQVLHPSFAVYVGVLVAALVVIGALVVTSRGVHGHLVRLGKCAIAGVIAATGLVVYVNSKKHAQLAAAAKSASGHRQSVTYLLTDAFVFTAVLVTVVLFAVVTLAARRRRVPVFGRPAHRRPARTGWPE
jgi:hypothetical protein